MKKPFNLKDWLTIADTARHLSKVFDDDFSEAEVLRLAIDGRLSLSVYFVNKAKARCGKIVPIAEAEYEEVPTLEGIGTVRLYKGPSLFSANGTPSHVIELEETVVTLSGVYDLTMLGDELQEIEHRYQMLTGGPAVTTEGLDGSFVKGRCEKICQLQDEERNHPMGGLPEDSVLVVRTEVLRQFEESIGDTAANTDNPLSTPEQKISEDEMHGALAEQVRNGEPIDFAYWCQRQAITASQAAKLVHGIDPIKWPENRHKQGVMLDELSQKIQRMTEWLGERSASWTLTALVDALDKDASLRMRYAVQEDTKHKAGRYTLKEAAAMMEKNTGERADAMLERLVSAVHSRTLPVYEPGKLARYQPKTVQTFYEEVYWNDLNGWLTNNEARIVWCFSDPAGGDSSGLADSGEVKVHIKYIADLHLEYPNVTAPEIMRICLERSGSAESPFTAKGRDLLLKGKSNPIEGKTFANYFTEAKKLAKHSR